MREDEIRRVAAKLGIRLGRMNAKGWMDAPCPFARWKHAKGVDRSPSFGVRTNEDGHSGYTCHTCGSHGTMRSLAHELGRLSGRDVSEAIAEIDVIEGEPGVLLTGVRWGAHAAREEAPPRPLDEDLSGGLYDPVGRHPEGLAYLAGRGVSAELAAALGLLYDDEQRRVLLPVRDRDGGLYGWSGRAIDRETKPKIRDYVGLPKRHLILGEHRWRRGRPTFVVEGLFGWLHLVAIGAERLVNVGAILGSEMTPEKAERLTWWGNTTVLALDADEAGEKGIFGAVDPATGRSKIRESALGRLWGHVPLIVPAWPMGKEDPDQLTLEDVATMAFRTPVWTPSPWEAAEIAGVNPVAKFARRA